MHMPLRSSQKPWRQSLSFWQVAPSPGFTQVVRESHTMPFAQPPFGPQ
jgi:hypothetical protein